MQREEGVTVEFSSKISINKLVVTNGKPLELTAGLSDNPDLLNYLARRRGATLGVTFTDVQGDLGLFPGLEDPRLPEGIVFDAWQDALEEGELVLEHFKEARGMSLRERQGYPYLVATRAIPVVTSSGEEIESVPVQVVLDFPALISWIRENASAFLEAMGTIPKVDAPKAGAQDGIPFEDPGPEAHAATIPQEELAAAIDPAVKAEIDGMDMKALLEKWRFSAAGDPLFQDLVGEYYRRCLNAARDADPEGWSQASKELDSQAG